MKTTEWKVWVTKNSQPITMKAPHSTVVEAHEWIWEQIGKRPVSITKIN